MTLATKPGNLNQLFQGKYNLAGISAYGGNDQFIDTEEEVQLLSDTVSPEDFNRYLAYTDKLAEVIRTQQKVTISDIITDSKEVSPQKAEAIYAYSIEALEQLFSGDYNIGSIAGDEGNNQLIDTTNSNSTSRGGLSCYLKKCCLINHFAVI